MDKTLEDGEFDQQETLDHLMTQLDSEKKETNRLLEKITSLNNNANGNDHVILNDNQPAQADENSGKLMSQDPRNLIQSGTNYTTHLP